MRNRTLLVKTAAGAGSAARALCGGRTWAASSPKIPARQIATRRIGAVLRRQSGPTAPTVTADLRRPLHRYRPRRTDHLKGRQNEKGRRKMGRLRKSSALY